MWQRIQAEGLAELYMDENNSEIHAQFHSLLALTFEPANHVIRVFRIIRREIADELQVICDHLEIIMF